MSDIFKQLTLVISHFAFDIENTYFYGTPTGKESKDKKRWIYIR